ncbi:MAG: RNA polymerase sigma factor [Silicimonas sp.]|nr:RNA polymerase sigma factor [Silicimonas sp.]
MDDADPREEIVEHLPALRAFALSLTRNRALADDIVQDTVIKAWTGFEAFQQGTKLRAWLFTILRNNFYSHHRRARREIEDVDGLHAARLAVSPSHDGRLMLGEVLAAFEQLTAEQREVLLLVGASGFSYDEAAEICGVSLGTVKSRINRGRRALGDMLGYGGGASFNTTDQMTRAAMGAPGDAA